MQTKEDTQNIFLFLYQNSSRTKNKKMKCQYCKEREALKDCYINGKRACRKCFSMQQDKNKGKLPLDPPAWLKSLYLTKNKIDTQKKEKNSPKWLKTQNKALIKEVSRKKCSKMRKIEMKGGLNKNGYI